MATLERLEVPYDLYRSFLIACMFFSSQTGNDTFNEAKLNEIKINDYYEVFEVSGQIDGTSRRSSVAILYVN
jgi:hypothetical protein